MIILDFSGGNTCNNDITYVKRMIDELVKVDSRKHEVIIKWQLFTDAPPNKPLHWRAFDFAYWYAGEKGYQTTSSVNDIESLRYLLRYDIPFVKIANKPDLYWLAGEVPRKIPVYASTGHLYKIKGNIFDEIIDQYMDITFVCISKYPATLKDYEDAYIFGSDHALINISDHTTTFELYNKYQPKIIEWHYKLSDSTGPDAGDFARTPEQLKEIL